MPLAKYSVVAVKIQPATPVTLETATVMQHRLADDKDLEVVKNSMYTKQYDANIPANVVGPGAPYIQILVYTALEETTSNS